MRGALPLEGRASGSALQSSSWPPSVIRVPGDPLRRSPIASVTCSAAARPKRASHARGMGSAFTIVPVASPSAIRAPRALDNLNVNVSSPSSIASSSSATRTVFSVSPAAKVSVPDAAV